jgi:hypothetical protein
VAHIPLYVRRGLYYQSLGRLWHVFQEFMQALFIAPRTYPIAYDKWVREQVEDSLGLPALYPHLTHLFEVGRLESEELVRKAQKLEELLEAHTGKTRRLPYEGKQGGPLDGGHAEKWLDVPAIASHRRFPERPVGRALPRNRPGVSSARRDWRVSRQLSQSGGHQAVRRLRVRRSLLSRRLGLTN